MSGYRDLVKLAGRLEDLGLEKEAGVLRAAFRKMAGYADQASGSVIGDDVEEGIAVPTNRPRNGRPSSVMSEEAFRAKYSKLGEKALNTLVKASKNMLDYIDLQEKTSESQYNLRFQQIWRNEYWNTPELKKEWADFFQSNGFSYSDVGADLASLSWGKQTYNQTTGLNSTQPTGMKLTKIADYVVSRLSEEQKQDGTSFYNAFTAEWAKVPVEFRIGFPQDRWLDLGPDMANKTWERIKPKPTSAPKPPSKPKGPMTDEQKWADYAKRIPGGQVVKSMWVTSDAGKALTGDASFDSFRSWLPTMMNATGVKNISATQLAGKLSDFKAAAYADKANGKTPGAPNTVLAALYANFNNQPEYARIVDSLGANKRIFDEPARLKQEKADRAQRMKETWESGPNLEEEMPSIK